MWSLPSPQPAYEHDRFCDLIHSNKSKSQGVQQADFLVHYNLVNSTQRAISQEFLGQGLPATQTLLCTCLISPTLYLGTCDGTKRRELLPQFFVINCIIEVLNIQINSLGEENPENTVSATVKTVQEALLISTAQKQNQMNASLCDLSGHNS